jgi:hypothetical protein
MQRTENVRAAESVERTERAEASIHVFSKKAHPQDDARGHTRVYGASHIGVELRSASIGSRVEHVKRGSAHRHGGASSIVWCVIVGVEGSGEGE